MFNAYYFIPPCDRRIVIDLRLLRHAVLLADARSFSKAAEMAGLSQPAFSRSIAALEARCGQRLFERSRVGVEPTALGAQIIAAADALLIETRGIEDMLDRGRHGLSGPAALGAGPLVAMLAFPGLLTILAKQRPGITIRTIIGAAPDLIQSLKARRIDFAIFAEPQLPIDADLVAEPAGTIHVGLIARAGHPLAGQKAIPAAALKSFPLATGQFPDGPRHVDLGGLTEEGQPALPRPTIICENFDILRKVVRDSNAIWLSSPEAVRDAPEEFVLLDVQPPLASTHNLLLVRRCGRLSPAAQSVARTLIAVLAGTEAVSDAVHIAGPAHAA